MPGAEIEIAAAYGDATPATIFKGVVVALRLKIDGGRGPRLVVTCRDKAFKMTLGRRNAVYQDQKDSDVISTLAGNTSLSTDISATSGEHPALVQYRCSDWDYAVARAEVNGMLVWAEAGKLHVKAPAFSTSAALTVTYGLDLIRFDAEVEARSQLASVAAQSWDIATQAASTGSAATAGENQWGNLTGATLAQVGALSSFGIETAATLTDSDLQTVAKARQARAELGRVRGRVHFPGQRQSEARGDAGARRSRRPLQRYCADLRRGAPHRGRGLDHRRQPRPRPGMAAADRGGLDVPGAAGLTAPVRGLQIGKVAKLTEDPASQNRVQVKLPLVGTDTHVWARLGGSYCTNGSGVMFLPEIDDEVIVGFLDEDPSHPVVLGSLHSSTLPPPVAANAENNIKTIVTRSKLKARVRRREEEDHARHARRQHRGARRRGQDHQADRPERQHGEARQRRHLARRRRRRQDQPPPDTSRSTAQSGDVKLSGMNVNANAQVGFVGKGAATAELSASGQADGQGRHGDDQLKETTMPPAARLTDMHACPMVTPGVPPCRTSAGRSSARACRPC